MNALWNEQSTAFVEKATKEQIFDIHKRVYDMTLTHLAQVKETRAERKNQHLIVLESYISDKLYEEFGLEAEHLDVATEQKELDQDPRYMQAFLKYQEEVGQLMS